MWVGHGLDLSRIRRELDADSVCLLITVRLVNAIILLRLHKCENYLFDALGPTLITVRPILATSSTALLHGDIMSIVGF